MHDRSQSQAIGPGRHTLEKFLAASFVQMMNAALRFGLLKVT